MGMQREQAELKCGEIFGCIIPEDHRRRRRDIISPIPERVMWMYFLSVSHLIKMFRLRLAQWEQELFDVMLAIMERGFAAGMIYYSRSLFLLFLQGMNSCRGRQLRSLP